MYSTRGQQEKSLSEFLLGKWRVRWRNLRLGKHADAGGSQIRFVPTLSFKTLSVLDMKRLWGSRKVFFCVERLASTKTKGSRTSSTTLRITAVQIQSSMLEKSVRQEIARRSWLMSEEPRVKTRLTKLVKRSQGCLEKCIRSKSRLVRQVHLLFHRVDKMVVLTASTVGRKESIWWTSSSGNALILSLLLAWESGIESISTLSMSKSKSRLQSCKRKRICWDSETVCIKSKG